MKEKIWLWGHKEGMQNNRWGLSGESKITPVEACKYMGIENLIFVREFGKPEPEEYERHAESFRELKKVVWSLVGAGGTFEEGEIERIINLKKKFPNIAGAIMDDFFVKPDKAGVFYPEEIAKIREKLHNNNLELYVVVYQHQLDLPVEKYLKECDVITYWIWWSEGIEKLEDNFTKFIKMTEGKRRMLGCYMWDYGNSKPMPLNLLEKQCNLGLKWLKQGKIEGIIFLASCICDLKIETVEWVRKWITSL